ncbi:MAG: tetratricopeptide repeat protein [Leptolyngbya sp. UWPOB_LEPTO1]|uniref:tetratricopeptide repeat protein n=1 Tax=Leptolyngbya sp. UWPOB_LEPTO1 TaxID=2815653 RepID=UPI001AD46C4D|nr:tetratricopeptide repeat protein [Leptolyngbya sp. UWPOB_LEPTO1]MBN8558888.1 tetratricopeptide repeat protein [Leptolyngbya sp. UWPOB_LEPTO1]
MIIDAQGLAVTSTRTDFSSQLRTELDRFIDQALYYGNQAEAAILQALALDPTCAIAQAYAAAYYLSQETAIARQTAMHHLKVAERYAATATEREQWYIRAISAWAVGAISEAINLHEAIAENYPQDLISVQQGQYHYFYRGESDPLLKIAEKVLPANTNNPHLHYLYGMIAFGLEQCGDLDRAMQTGLQAISLNRFDPWAQHAIAHILEEQNRPEDGILWMESHSDTWEQCNSMLYTHNWWHVALYYLALGNHQKVLELYDQKVWGRANPSSSKDQVGAIATLLRLEVQGVNVGKRWQALAPHLGSRLHEHALPFQDLHYIYALARAGYTDWVNEFLQSLTSHAQQLPATSQFTWLQIVLPVAKGLVAYTRQDWSTTVSAMQPRLSYLHTVGGSRTQQKMFGQIYQQAVLRNQSGKVRQLWRTVKAG